MSGFENLFRFWESELLSCYAVDTDQAPHKPVDDDDDDDDVDGDDDDDDHPADEGWSEDVDVAGGWVSELRWWCQGWTLIIRVGTHLRHPDTSELRHFRALIFTQLSSL